MYDWPEVREATDEFWAAMARRLGSDVRLSRPEDFAAAWTRDDLLFSQTCGYPFTHALKGKVSLVATPHYGCDGCDGPFYSSIVFAREQRPLDAFRGAVAAVNTPDSMSGMLALKLVFGPYAEQGRFFGRAIETGGHLKSLAACTRGAGRCLRHRCRLRCHGAALSPRRSGRPARDRKVAVGSGSAVDHARWRCRGTSRSLVRRLCRPCLARDARSPFLVWVFRADLTRLRAHHRT